MTVTDESSRSVGSFRKRLFSDELGHLWRISRGNQSSWLRCSKIKDQATDQVLNEIQLKSTDNPDYVEEHMRRYPDIEIVATEEVAYETGVSSSEFRDEELERKVAEESGNLANNIELDQAVRRGLGPPVVLCELLLRGGRASSVEDWARRPGFLFDKGRVTGH